MTDISDPAKSSETSAVVPAAVADGRSARSESNARLTSWAGLVLFVLLAVLGVTILRIHQLLAVHIAVGFGLIAPLVVKLVSTGWRFVHYYAGDQDYVLAGPPRPLLRILAPLVVISTLAVVGTGVALIAAGPGGRSELLVLHKITFVAWFGVMTVHVVAYILPALRWVGADLGKVGAPRVLARRRARQFAVAASLVAGVLLAFVGLRWGHPWLASSGVKFLRGR
ncbi:MAG: hypothetical protein ACRDZ8_01645 [Acidimicrobiales bacterium]